jgi:DNA-directed RNA polymerase specialized sigma24 family protein
MTIPEFLDLYQINRVKALESAHKGAYWKCVGHLINNSCPEGRAKDIFVDALLILDRHSSRGTLKVTNLKTLISSYLCAVCLKIWKNGGRESNLIPTEPDDPILFKLDLDDDDHFSDEDMLEKMRRSFRMLSDQCQEILGLFYFNGCSMKEIMETCDYATTDAAKTAKYRCLERLRTLFI